VLPRYFVHRIVHSHRSQIATSRRLCTPTTARSPLRELLISCWANDPSVVAYTKVEQCRAST
jgi:hypothetical protein